MPSLHSEFPPSSMDRLILCPASWSRSKGRRKAESASMREGTLAHAVLENKNLGRAPSDWKLPKGAKHRDITSDIISAVQIAVDEVELLRSDDWPAQEGIEEKVSLADWGLPFVWGTADYVRRLMFRKLIVLDYKHGAGVWVDPNSDQLRTYAAGAAGKDLMQYGEIELVIVQPRCTRKGGPLVRRHIMTSEELASWVNDKLIPAIDNAKSANPRAVPGERQCMWCEGKTNCPEYSQASLAVVDLQFADLCKLEPVKSPLVPEDPEVLGRIYRQLPLLEGWIKMVKAATATATKDGKATGMKFVAGRNKRSWDDPDGAVKVLTEEYGLGTDELYTEPSLKTVAAVEKLISGGKKILAPFVKTEQGGPVLAPLEDKRPAVDAALLEFADLAEEN